MLTNLDVNPETTLHCSGMRCGSCGWDSPQGIIFCTNCGKRLAEHEGPGTPGGLVPQAQVQGNHGTQVFGESRAPATVSCPGCGAVGQPGMRFCRECGTALTEGVSPTGARAFTPVDAPSPAPSRSSTPRLVMLLKDGSEGRSIPLTEKDADVGSSEGDITFPDDPYISPRHARVMCRAGTYSVRDLDSPNGVYVRLRDEVELRDRDMLLVGQQVLRFEVLGDAELPLGPAFQHGVMVFGTPELARFARLVQYTTEGVTRDVHYLFRDETVIGRENGDIVFTDDPFLSRRHAAIRVDHVGRRFALNDLGSSNGTALRIRGEHVLKDADQFRIGRHLFRFEAGAAGGRVAR